MSFFDQNKPNILFGKGQSLFLADMGFYWPILILMETIENRSRLF